MGSNKKGLVLVVGADLLGRTRIEETVGRSGLTAQAVPPAKLGEADLEDVKAIFADVDSDEVLDSVTTFGAMDRGLVLVGYFAHVDRARAERVKAAGWQALPRGRLFRELPDLLKDL